MQKIKCISSALKLLNLLKVLKKTNKILPKICENANKILLKEGEKLP